jgi:hypothetical protein
MSTITAEGIGTPKVTGFVLQSSNPLDVREWVADQTNRLALDYPYFGLLTRQGDTDQVYRYLGDGSTNVLADWELVTEFRYGATTPAGTLGNIGDTYLAKDTRNFYEKTGTTTWTLLFDLSGANIYADAGAPSGGLGVDGDAYFRDDGGVYRKEASVWVLKFNIRGTDGVSELYATTSSTSVNLGTASFPFAITVGTGLSYTPGQSIIVASTADPAVDYFTATVDSYVTGSGLLTLASGTLFGTLAHTDWNVNLQGSTGKAGKALIHTAFDIVLTEAVISAVEGGSYTPDSPYSASVLTDNRSNLSLPTALAGSRVSHSISYDGTSWYDNGLWRGAKGNTGTAGATGATGSTGATGAPGIAIQRNYSIGNSLINTLNVTTETATGYYELRIFCYNNKGGTIILPNLLSDVINYKVIVYVTGVNTGVPPINIRVQYRVNGIGTLQTIFNQNISTYTTLTFYNGKLVGSSNTRNFYLENRYDNVPVALSGTITRFHGNKSNANESLFTSMVGSTAATGSKQYPNFTTHNVSGGMLIKAFTYVNFGNTGTTYNLTCELWIKIGVGAWQQIEVSYLEANTSGTSFGQFPVIVEKWIPDAQGTVITYLKITPNVAAGLRYSLDTKYSVHYETNIILV